MQCSLYARHWHQLATLGLGATKLEPAFWVAAWIRWWWIVSNCGMEWMQARWLMVVLMTLDPRWTVRGGAESLRNPRPPQQPWNLKQGIIDPTDSRSHLSGHAPFPMRAMAQALSALPVTCTVLPQPILPILRWARLWLTCCDLVYWVSCP